MVTFIRAFSLAKAKPLHLQHGTHHMLAHLKQNGIQSKHKHTLEWVITFVYNKTLEHAKYIILGGETSLNKITHIIHTYSSSHTSENNTKTSIVNSMKVKHKHYATNTLDSSLHAMWYHFSVKNLVGRLRVHDRTCLTMGKSGHSH